MADQHRSLRADCADTELLGKRGEQWFVAQAALLLLLFFPPMPLEVPQICKCEMMPFSPPVDAPHRSCMSPNTMQLALRTNLDNSLLSHCSPRSAVHQTAEVNLLWCRYSCAWAVSRRQSRGWLS